MTQEKALSTEVLSGTIDLPYIQQLGAVFMQSGMFADIKSQAQAIVKIIAGAELGFPPLYSMRKVYIIQGQLAIAAEMIGAQIKRSGRYDYRVTQHSDTECVVEFLDNQQAVYLSRFTLEDARRAGLVKPGSGWEKFPRALLFSRALSQGARIVAPHLIGGAYTPEEMGLAVDEDGVVLEAERGTVEDAKAPPEAPRPSPPPMSPPQPAVAVDETPIDRGRRLLQAVGWNEGDFNAWCHTRPHVQELLGEAARFKDAPAMHQSLILDALERHLSEIGLRPLKVLPTA